MFEEAQKYDVQFFVLLFILISVPEKICICQQSCTVDLQAMKLRFCEILV